MKGETARKQSQICMDSFLENDRFVFFLFIIVFDAWRDPFPTPKFFFAWSILTSRRLSDSGEINAKQFFRDLDFPPLNLR